MSATNELLTEVLCGAAHDWESYIVSLVKHRMPQVVRQGRLDDVVTDVTSDFVIQSRDGGLQEAIVKAKSASGDDAELVKNMKGVLTSGIWYRISTAIRNKRTTTTFTDLLTGSENAHPGWGHRYVKVDRAARSDGDREYLAYGEELIAELERMAVETESRNNKNRKKKVLAKRYRLGKSMIPGRLAGKTMKELQAEFGVKSTSTMQAIFDDIGQALARIAGRSQDPILLRGTELVA